MDGGNGVGTKVRDESAVWKGLKRFLKDRNALIALATYLVLLLVVCIAIWVKIHANT